MKRCSTCNRTYDDPKLIFCVDDGTPLTPVDVEDDTTVVRPRTENDNDWNAVGYQPPAAYVPPGDTGKPRKVSPWILGIAGAFVLGILALSLAAILLLPRLKNAARNERAAVANRNQAENSNTNAATENNSNPNANANENVNTPPPADHDQVLAQLRDLEQEWTVANVNADKKKLERILADDFVAEGQQGQLQSKADYIRTIERDTVIQKWDFSDLKVSLAGERATLSGIFTYFSADGSVSYDFTDKFVWRDGRWQATGAEIKRRGTPEVDL